MNFRVLTAAVSAAVIGTTAPALAASILIDDFGTNQRVEDEPLSTGNASQVSGGDIIGGYRDLLVQTDQGLEAGSVLVARQGQLEFNNDVSVTGRGWVTYDGSNEVGGSAGNVATSGLGGIDFLIGPESLTGFLFEIVDVDLPGFYIEIRHGTRSAALRRSPRRCPRAAATRSWRSRSSWAT
jgi:hypothetical protein